MTNIVMITRDRYRLTEQSLVSLYANTRQENFNLTIVDDGSEDFRVRRMLNQWAESHSNCALLRLENSNHVLSQAKNIGAAYSEQRFGRGDFLYLSDNDVYFTISWLHKLTKLATASFLSGFRLWGGQIHPFHLPCKADMPSLFDDDTVSMHDYDVLDGVSWLMHWETWDDWGPLDRTTAPGPCQSEEYPFCKKLRDAHLRIGVIEPHVVYHTGLTNSDGKLTPGYTERMALMVKGVLYE